MFLSTDLTHDAHGVQHFESITIKTLQRLGVHIEKAIHFSDGAGSQYKGRTNFVDISFGIEDLRITRERHYFGSRHGKGECDGEIGVLKSVALLAVRRRLAVIPDAQSLYDFSLAHHTKDSNGEEVKRTYFFVGQGEIQRDRPTRTGNDIKTLKGSRSVHAVRGEYPYSVYSRTRSCFCRVCTEEEEGVCPNIATCGAWIPHQLKKKGAFT